MPKRYKYIIITIALALLAIIIVYIIYDGRIDAMEKMLLQQPP